MKGLACETTCEAHPFQRGGGGGGGGGGHSHRCRVQSCDWGQDAVKQSRHFLGVGQTVKQCAGGTICGTTGDQEACPIFCACAVVDGQGSIRRGQAVKVAFRRSKILNLVVALDTAPMGVTPPLAFQTSMIKLTPDNRCQRY